LQEPSEDLAAKTAHLKEKLVKLKSEMQRLAAMEKLMLASPDQQISPNLAKNIVPTNLNQLWVADITYIAIAKAAAQGHTTFDELVAAAADQIQAALSLFT
jgi:hypothetical protein